MFLFASPARATPRALAEGQRLWSADRTWLFDYTGWANTDTYAQRRSLKNNSARAEGSTELCGAPIDTRALESRRQTRVFANGCSRVRSAICERIPSCRVGGTAASHCTSSACTPDYNCTWSSTSTTCTGTPTPCSSLTQTQGTTQTGGVWN